MKHVRIGLTVALAFATGALVARPPAPVRAAAAPAEAAVLDVNAIAPADFPAPNPATPNLRSKMLAKVDTTAFYYQIGVAPKHTHANTTEVQLFLDGTGTEWLGDKEVPVKPGTVLVIPPNTPHGGLVGGPFKIYTVKTPPQDPADYHPLP